MNASSFCHLHCHSHYSLLDGAGSIDTRNRSAQEVNSQAEQWIEDTMATISGVK